MNENRNSTTDRRLTDQRVLTEGEWRVGINFNPSKDSAVDKVKALAAELIDLALAEGTDQRTAALAATAFEDGAMWAVKPITKQPHR